MEAAIGGQPGEAAARRDAGRAAMAWQGGGMTALAIALAVGITVGWNQPTPRVWPWLIAAMIVAVAAAKLRFHHAGWTHAALVLSMACFGAGWVTLQHWIVDENDLAAHMGEESMLLRVEGVATGAPVSRQRTSGSMASFDYRAPATYFPMRIEALISRHDERVRMQGSLLVRVDEAVMPFRPGDRVRAMGYVMRPAEPRNPGEFDYRQYARSLQQAGILSVPGRELLEVTAAKRNSLVAAYMNWRDLLRRRASAWLLADLPETERTQRDQLLASLMLGEREPEIDGLYERFQRVGLAHILAISGFHLGVLAGFVLLFAQFIGKGRHRRWHGWLVIAVVLLYLLMVEARMPVLRAGVMTIAASLGLIFGRHLRVGGLISLSAIGLLIWRPDQLFDPGFQLSYAVVLALVHFVPGVQRRIFRQPKHPAISAGQMIGEWAKVSLVVSLVAWLAALPIVAHHFGTVSPLGVALNLVVVPLSAVLLTLGFLKMALAAFLPSAALLLGVPLSIGAEMMVSIVETVDGLPWSSMHVPFPNTWLALAMLAWVCWWGTGARGKRSRRVMWSTALLLGCIWFWPLAASRFSDHATTRIDMLSVGDGSCYLVRSAGSAVMFDAGSSTDLNAGRRSIVPALRRLGVRSIDAIAISHANLDHYSAVLEVAEAFDVGEALVTPQLMAEAQGDPLGPVAELTRRLTAQRIALTEISAGAERQFGRNTWMWLHPHADRVMRRGNDNSMVIRVAVPSQVASTSILFCGDIQEEAMAMLLRDANLAADIVELPHHGSHHELAEAFIARVNPKIVLQSTGWTRWRRDRWSQSLARTERLVTARDGACWVEIDAGGRVTMGRFVNQSAAKAEDPGP